MVYAALSVRRRRAARADADAARRARGAEFRVLKVFRLMPSQRVLLPAAACLQQAARSPDAVYDVYSLMSASGRCAGVVAEGGAAGDDCARRACGARRMVMLFRARVTACAYVATDALLI